VESKSYRALPPSAGGGPGFKSRQPDQIPQRVTARDIIQTLLLESILGRHGASMLPTLNRSAVIVTPKQPFLDWLHGVDPTSLDLTLDDVSEPTIYLLLAYGL
jgi:hypothetical protein